MSSSVEGHLNIGPLEELRYKQCIVVDGGEFNVAVFYHNRQVYAVDDRCPHRGYGLNTGTIKDGVVSCIMHQAKFDLASGASLDPAINNICTFPVKVVDGEVWVDPAPYQKT